MNRRTFIEWSAILAAMSPFLEACTPSKRNIPGCIVGASSKIGHLLRESTQSSPVSTEQIKIVIIGGGVTGLSAARHLVQHKQEDFLLLELENHLGGNASSGRNELSAFPWGAHYIPIPNNDLKEYLEFLQEIGVIEYFDEKGLPFYNEKYLCFDPQERLYINGRWQDGLIPQFGVPDKEMEEIRRFLDLMDQYRHKKGIDGLFAFAIPVDKSSKDQAFSKLDGLTMKSWLELNGFSSSYLHQYVNYCCRDDFGTSHEKISAWAGIHYFAARKGEAANAHHSDVLTWPEGNGFLVEQLQKNISSKIRTGTLVKTISQVDNKLWIDYFDVATNTLKRIEADHCIVAVPQFVAARLLNDSNRLKTVKENLHYAPWMVANFTVQNLEDRSGAPLSWDNVIQNGQSLGYVEATHQVLSSTTIQRNLTYYLPLTNRTAEEERKQAADRTHVQWVEMMMEELERLHPNIREAVKKVDIMLWGHAMAQPLPGIIFGDTRKSLSESIGKNLHFAHTDLAGISIFEEAFYQGINAANKIIQSA